METKNYIITYGAKKMKEGAEFYFSTYMWLENADSEELNDAINEIGFNNIIEITEIVSAVTVDKESLLY